MRNGGGGTLLWKNRGKFFKRIAPDDLARYQDACTLWEGHKARLPYPTSEIPEGFNTNQMLKHNYRYWHQMFNPRQLLSLATILDAVQKEELVDGVREMLLCLFSATLERNNMFCRFFNDRNTIQANFDRHDFAPKLTPAENSPFQNADIRGSLPNMFERLLEGKRYCRQPYDNIRRAEGEDDEKTIPSSEAVYTGTASLACDDSRAALARQGGSVDAVITDPPYAGNVNYSELSDFFYVWLRLALKDRYAQFVPEYVPKAPEIVENQVRGKSRDDFREGLQGVFSLANGLLPDAGLMVFTFHHNENSAWESVLEAIAQAGFDLLAAYPVHGDKESSLMLMDSASMSYDLVHVCRKRAVDPNQKSWAGVRQKIRERARQEVRMIQAGRSSLSSLSPGDRAIVLIGKCLELYSQHYGKIVDHEGRPVPLHNALEDIRMMVDQLTTADSALPPELEDIDPASYVYLTCLCDQREIKSDEVSKATRGVTEPAELLAHDLMIKGRAKRGRTYEVKAPVERLDALKRHFGADSAPGKVAQGLLFDEALTPVAPRNTLFVDYVHLLLGLATVGESVAEWLDRFRGQRPQIRAALDYLARRNPAAFAEPVKKIAGLMDEVTLFTRKE